jgi:hypothetical protein
VAQDCPGSGCEQGGDAAPAVGEGLVADGVDAVVDADQASRCQAVTDLPGGQPKRQQLLPADNTALTGGQASNQNVERSAISRGRSTFWS